MPKHFCVTGLACDKGYPKEDERDCIAPVRPTMCMKFMMRSAVDSSHAHESEEVLICISRSKNGSDGMQPVRQAHSRSEDSVIRADAKGPDFCESFADSSGRQIHPSVKVRT